MSAAEKLSLFESNPEVTSYIYQQLAEFEPFLTSRTLVSVVSKNPLHLRGQLAEDGLDISKENLKKMHRIAIVMTEGKGRIEAEGLHENIFQAIREAKQKIQAKLEIIQDKVVTNQDRILQINALKSSKLRH